MPAHRTSELLTVCPHCAQGRLSLVEREQPDGSWVPFSVGCQFSCWLSPAEQRELGGVESVRVPHSTPPQPER